MNLDVTESGIVFGSSLANIEVPDQLRRRVDTGITYLNKAYGGLGLTPSVVTLFTGTPGAGKTSMLLGLCDRLAKSGHLAVFNTGEESLYQVKLHAERLGLSGQFAIGQEVVMPQLLTKFEKLRKKRLQQGKDAVLVIDSLQTMNDGYYKNGRITSKTSIRALEMVTNYAKKTYTNVIVIGQVNKSGKMAGRQALKHIVDALIHLDVVDKEKHEFYGSRRIFTEKNRFGGAGYTGYLRLKSHGFVLEADTQVY